MRSPILNSLLVVFAFVAASLPRAEASDLVTFTPPTNPSPLGSTVVSWDSLVFRPTPIGFYCPVFDQPTRSLEKFELHVTVLQAGMASHAPHRHPWEELLLVKEGTVEALINGKREQAGPGALIFLASHDVHNVTNFGMTPATYYVINFVTDTALTMQDRPAAEWAPPQMLTSRVVDCDRLTGGANKTGFHREVFDSPTLTFQRLESHLTTLNPGASTRPKSRDPGDELFIVKSGAVEVTLNDVTSHVGAGSFYYVAPNDERTMKNLGRVPAVYQVFKAVSDKSPKPET